MEGPKTVFKIGRTETTRTLSVDSLNFTKAMVSPNVSKEKKRELLRKAAKQHVAYQINAINNKGCDRHLFLLKILSNEAVEQNEFSEIPEIFTDPLMSKSATFQLSTSAMPKSHFYSSFGPVCHDGYGMCYQVAQNRCRAGITAFKDCKETDATIFRDTVVQCLRDVRELFDEKSKL